MFRITCQPFWMNPPIYPQQCKHKILVDWNLPLDPVLKPNLLVIDKFTLCLVNWMSILLVTHKLPLLIG